MKNTIMPESPDKPARKIETVHKANQIGISWNSNLDLPDLDRNTKNIETLYNHYLTYVDKSPTLRRCIESMISLIEGQGYKLKKAANTEGKDFDESVEFVEDYLSSCFNGNSFDALRKCMRGDIETYGNAFISVTYDENLNIANMNIFPPTSISYERSVDMVSNKTFSNGYNVNLNRPYKVYCVRQKRGRKVSTYYYGEFEAPNVIDPSNGNLGAVLAEGESVGVTQIIHLKLHSFKHGVYSYPRWHSAINSIRTEIEISHQSYKFINSGGIPPVMAFISNGYIDDKELNKLRNAFVNSREDRNKIPIVNITSDDSSDDSTLNPTLHFERFGAEGENDPMFIKSQQLVKRNIREVFGLPSLVFGDAEDYNFASASTAFKAAESYIFGPEREWFDALFNTRILPRIYGEHDKNLYILSNRAVLNDPSLQAVALNAINGKIHNKDFVDAVKQVSNISIPSDVVFLDGETISVDQESVVREESRKQDDNETSI